MIVVAEGGELLLITQGDHARFAAQLLSLWRPELAGHPRRELLIRAVREHDNGWRETDAAPRLEASSGRPYDFRELPGEHRRELWRRCVERFAAESPYVALLAARHSQQLHADRAGDPAWAGYLEELTERLEELRAAAGLDETELAADYRWLELADTLSLLACCRAEAAVSRGPLKARLAGGELLLEPFPLAGATTFEVPSRRIADRRYGGEAELANALGRARWTPLAIRCRPARG